MEKVVKSEIEKNEMDQSDKTEQIDQYALKMEKSGKVEDLVLKMDEFLESGEKKSSSPQRKKTGKSINSRISSLKILLKTPEYKEIVNCDGLLKAPSSKIYKKISEAMEENNRLSPKYIYTILLGNRYNVYSEVLESLNIKNPCEESVIESSFNTSSTFFEFRINVTQIWPSIKPEKQYHCYKNRDRIVYRLRKNSWTHVLFEEIQAATNLPCALSFKHSQISESGIFVSIQGSCSECPCKFFGEIIQEPKTDEEIYMECKIVNFDSNIHHTKKRHLQGKLRKAVANMLIKENLLPSQHRRNEAHRLIQTVGDDSPPHLIKGDIFGKAKREGLNQKLGTTSSTALEGLYNLKYDDNKSQGAIRNIGLDPPFVYYWSKEQQLIFEKFSNTLYLDGTGSVVKSIKLPNGSFCSHIYLYQALADVNDKSVPVFQMLSSSQTTVSIMSWLLEFRRIGCIECKNYPLPKETVTDFDKALLGALARAYAEVKSLKYYLHLCYKIIRGAQIEIPACILRLDVCHYTQMIARWKCFSEHQPGVRGLYLRAMCILRKQEDFAEFEKMATSILTLALCRNGNKGSSADKAKDFLRQKIKGVNDEIVEHVLADPKKFEHLDEVDVYLEDDNDNVEGFMALGEWVSNIYETVDKISKNESVTDNDDVNGYRLPTFAVKVKELLPYFPIFTEILRKLRGFGKVNPTSAAAESYFNDLKNRTFKSVGLPLRADKFVAIHIVEIEKKLKDAATGSLTMTRSGNIEAVVKKPKLEESENAIMEKDRCVYNMSPNSENELNIEHNWRNKNKKESSKEQENVQQVVQKRKGAQYGEPCPQFEPFLEKNTWMPVLFNGSRCRNIRERMQITVVRNSCAFDSLVQILSMGMLSNELYSQEVEDVPCDIFSFAQLFIKKRYALQSTKREQKFYEIRKLLLQKFLNLRRKLS